MSVRELLGVERLGASGLAGKAAPRRRWMRRYIAVLVGVDAGAAVVAAVTAYLIRFTDGSQGYLAFSLALPVIWVASAALARAYDDRVVGLGAEEFQRVARAFVALTAFVGFCSYATKAEVARGYVVLALPMAVALSLAGRYAARKRLHALRRSGRCVHDVIAVGGEHSVLDLVTRLRREQYSGMRVVGACLASGDGAQIVGLGVPLFGGLNGVGAAVRATGADTVAVTSSAELDPARLRRLAWELEGTATDLVVAPGLMEVAGPRLHIRPVTGLPLLHVEEPEFAGARRVVKGAVDRVVAAVALLVMAPVLLGVMAAIRLTSQGPAIFRQTRIGKDGREFTMLKFRSMYVDAEARRAELLGPQRARRRPAVQDPRRPAGHARGQAAAQAVAGRAAAAGQRADRPHVAGRPAPAAAGRGRPLRGRRPPPAAGQARPDRPLADQRPQRPDLGRVGPARPALRRELVADARPDDPLEDRLRRGEELRRLLSRRAVPGRPAAERTPRT